MRITIVTPGAAADRPGNRVTADRWAGLLRELGHAVEVAGAYEDGETDLLLALHARKSHRSIVRFREDRPGAPLVVALTGTDLYRDMEDPESEAWASVRLADRLVVLQEKAPEALPPSLRKKTRVIYQSVPEAWVDRPSSGVAERPAPETGGADAATEAELSGAPVADAGASDAETPVADTGAAAGGGSPADPEHARGRDVDETGTPSTFQVCFLAHLRPVKDPFRAALAARLLPDESRIRIVHCGKATTGEMEGRAREEVATNPRYVWLGEVSRAKALAILRRSRLLVLTSRLEGAGNAISEALTVGVPVVCSRIPGLIGMLGEDYPGFFEVGDTRGLARLLRRAEAEPAFLRWLRARCERRRPLLDPAREREALRDLLRELTPTA